MFVAAENLIAICLLIALLSLVAAILPQYVIPVVLRRAERWGILDLPDKRKTHVHPTPRLGGLAIAPVFWLSTSVLLVLISNVTAESSFLATHMDSFGRSVLGLLIGTSGMFLLGAIDDVRRLHAGQKLAVQALIAIIAVQFLPVPESVLGFPLNEGLAQLLMLGWLVLLPNSVNLLDGVDGLTGSLSALFFFVVSILSLLSGQYGWLFLTVPSLVAVSSFLRFNWNPARIFLGDSGSLSLGFMITYLSLSIALPVSSAGEVGSWNIFLSLLLSSIWLLDTGLAISRRYFEKMPDPSILKRRSKTCYFALHGNALKNVCRPDRRHIHHRLLDLGLNPKQVTVLLSVLAGSMMSASVLFYSPSSSSPEFVRSSTMLESLSLLGLFGVLCAFFLLSLGTLMIRQGPRIRTKEIHTRKVA